jgi:hypothetical protein
MQKIQEPGKGGNAYAEGDYSSADGGDAGDSTTGPGGDGGDAHAQGVHSVAVGGRGGRGGVGKGGSGMDALALQDNVAYYGGDGGESSQQDGRGGRGGSAQVMEVFGAEFARRARMKLPYGAPNNFPGRGGDSPDSPQHKARRLIVERIKAQYFVDHQVPAGGDDVWYDRRVVPLDWIVRQLDAAGHKWIVEIEDEEYVFTDRAP